MLQVNVRALPSEIGGNSLSGKAVAVIDVLRATTVMATALENGAACIYTRAEIDDARKLKLQLGADALLSGERNGNRIEGFDLGNSPFEFRREVVENRNLIMCTTNGTRAIEAARAASHVVALSFVNLSAASEYLFNTRLPVELICAGTNGRFSLDDALCAGMALMWLAERTSIKTDDLGTLLLQLAGQPGSIGQKLQRCSHRLFLEASGYGKDVAFCLTPDQFSVVPVMSSSGCFVRA